MVRREHLFGGATHMSRVVARAPAEVSPEATVCSKIVSGVCCWRLSESNFNPAAVRCRPDISSLALPARSPLPFVAYCMLYNTVVTVSRPDISTRRYCCESKEEQGRILRHGY